MGLKVIPVILAGGVGTRLWPLSREAFPKQFLRLVSQYSLLQETVLRAQHLIDIAQPLIVCNADHYFLSQDHLKEINVSGYQYILEPFGKNTAAAIACAAYFISQKITDEAILLVLPSDHYIADQDLFFDAVYRARTVAQRGFLVTFGVTPTSPETGYGYIEAGDALLEDTYRVKKFIEKPQLELAQQFIESRGFYWNSGMFMFKPQIYLEELERTFPDIYQAAVQATLKGEQKADYLRLNAEVFANCPNSSIDYAVMEKTHKAVVIPLSSSWNDLGCWTAVAKTGMPDAENNVIKGEAFVKDSKDCFISAEGQMVAALGLQNQIIVTTPDVVLVANKAYSQDVRQIVNQLKSYKSKLVMSHKKQYDAPGSCETEYFTVESLILKPLSNLTLSPCPYPTHLLVVSGSAEALVNHQISRLTLNNSLYMDKQAACNIINNTDQPLHLLRIQLKLQIGYEIPEQIDTELSVA